MRTILKYIGIFLIINCSMGVFTVERREEFQLSQNFTTNTMLKFGFELDLIFIKISPNMPQKYDANHMTNLQNQINLLESQFRDGSLYDRIDILSTVVFDETFLVRDDNNKPIKNYINSCQILTDMMIDLDLGHNWSSLTYLSQKYSESYGSIKNVSLQYKNLYMQSLNNPDKTHGIDKFSDLFAKICHQEPYFKDVFQPFYQAIEGNNLDEALTQMTLQFAFFNDLLGKDTFGIPHYFNNYTKKIDGINTNESKTNNHSEISSQPIETKETDPKVLKLFKDYKNLSFNIIDVIHRIGFLKLFQQTVNDFQSNHNFPQWINNHKNFINYVSFQSFFLTLVLRDVDLFVVVPSLTSLRNNEYDNIIIFIRNFELFIKSITDEISHGVSHNLIEKATYQINIFNKVMNNFVYLFNNLFKEYFIQKILKPSKEELEIIDFDVTKKIQNKKTTNLTPLEKNILELSNILNATLKSSFKRPSKENIEENFVFSIEIKGKVFKIIKDFLNSIKPIIRKYLTKDYDIKLFNSTAWLVFLSTVNPKNKKLYIQYLKEEHQIKNQIMNKLSEKHRKYLEDYNRNNLDDFNPKEAILNINVKEEEHSPVQNFTQKNLKAISEANKKQYKKESKTTMEKSLENSKEEEGLPLFNQFQTKILEATGNFYDIAANKIDSYKSYIKSLNTFNNTLKNSINLMEIPITNGKSPLNLLIKKLQNLGADPEPLNQIKEKINDTKTYESNGTWIELDESLNFDQINKLIKKEKEKVEVFHKIIGLLSRASDYLNEFITNWVQRYSDENPTVVDFPTKNSLVVAPIPSQPFYQSGHIPKIQGEPGQEGPTARMKKKQKKPEEVKILFQDAIDQEKEREEAEKKMKEEEQKNQEEEKKREEALEEGKKELRKIGAQAIKEELEQQEQANQEQIKAIVQQIELKFSLQKKQ